jgi:hypothetical protein
MGNEVQCTVRLGRQKFQGKALLETSELLFRATDGNFRLKLAFPAIQGARASAES